jgi:hypothetical protein
VQHRGACSSQLPYPWEALVDQSGQPYFYNPQRRRTVGPSGLGRVDDLCLRAETFPLKRGLGRFDAPAGVAAMRRGAPMSSAARSPAGPHVAGVAAMRRGAPMSSTVRPSTTILRPGSSAVPSSTGLLAFQPQPGPEAGRHTAQWQPHGGGVIVVRPFPGRGLLTMPASKGMFERVGGALRTGAPAED